jgi:phosphoribosyl 1,2-cyclic phosphodiesterase/ActR/RegA family two-component response regulator
MPTQTKLHFLIVDDDHLTAEIHASLLRHAGFQVTCTATSAEALEKIISIQPDCVLSDLLMPDLDGLELFQAVRKIPNIKQPSFIIITGKLYEFDRRRAFELGVDGYLVKPIDAETFVAEIRDIVDGTMKVQFWGTRGTLPVAGKNSVRYGGNTNCVTLSVSHKHFLIFDAGTGIKELSNYLIRENKLPMSAKIFISHPHYDHINGLPFFAPLYMKGNDFEIMGTNHGDMSIEKLLANQMDSVYFPITMKEFSATIKFRNLSEEEFNIDGLHVRTIFLNHPGRCLGYRVEHKDKSFCYITDNELYLENSPHYNQFDVDRLVKFIHGTDLLVIDTTYTDKEYKQKTGWGHSCVSRVIDVADKANVKILCLYHHDPDQFDDDIDLKVKNAVSLLESRSSSVRCIAAAEGDIISI